MLPMRQRGHRCRRILPTVESVVEAPIFLPSTDALKLTDEGIAALDTHFRTG